MRTNVLDNGYIELVESWGSDERIIEAARMSTSKGFLGWGGVWCECNHLLKDHRDSGTCLGGSDDGGCLCSDPRPVTGDEKLLRYLWEHKHHTPFEMAGATIEVQAPIFVFREWHRHRTQSYNELSARYTPLPNVNYLPSVERLRQSGGSNRQATSIGAELTEHGADRFRSWLVRYYDDGQRLYEQALRDGVPKELARLCVPVARYSRMRASANLRNWLGFLTLRMDKAAQWEIRMYANALAVMLRVLFPRTMGLFDESRAD